MLPSSNLEDGVLSFVHLFSATPFFVLANDVRDSVFTGGGGPSLFFKELMELKL